MQFVKQGFKSQKNCHLVSRLKFLVSMVVLYKNCLKSLLLLRFYNRQHFYNHQLKSFDEIFFMFDSTIHQTGELNFSWILKQERLIFPMSLLPHLHCLHIFFFFSPPLFLIFFTKRNRFKT